MGGLNKRYWIELFHDYTRFDYSSLEEIPGKPILSSKCWICNSIHITCSFYIPIFCTGNQFSDRGIRNLINIFEIIFCLNEERHIHRSFLFSELEPFCCLLKGQSSYSSPGFLIHYWLVCLICNSPKGFSVLWLGKQKAADWNSLVVAWLSSIECHVILR